MSRCLVVLGFLSLMIPGTAAASGRAPARKAKTKTAVTAKKSKEKLAVGRTKGKSGGKGSPKAAGFLPRPGAKGAGAPALTVTRTAAAASSRTRTPAVRRGAATRSKTLKAKTAKKTRKTTPKKKRAAARTTRSRSRSSQQLDTGAAEMAAAEGPDGMDADREMGAMDFEGPARPQSRFRRILSGTGRVLKSAAKYAGYGLVVAAPMAVLAVGGLPIAFAIGAPAIFLGIPMAIGLIEQRAKQNQGIDDPQGELLQRYMSRQMLENNDLNGPGPGNGVAGVGGLSSLNNMIDPGGMR
ncbi:MAG TPA: hypothetical protein VIG06_27225 [Kofleriaceae bacterium]